MLRKGGNTMENENMYNRQPQGTSGNAPYPNQRPYNAGPARGYQNPGTKFLWRQFLLWQQQFIR